MLLRTAWHRHANCTHVCDYAHVQVYSNLCAAMCHWMSVRAALGRAKSVPRRQHQHCIYMCACSGVRRVRCGTVFMTDFDGAVLISILTFCPYCNRLFRPTISALRPAMPPNALPCRPGVKVGYTLSCLVLFF